jgi:hypothetical protein
MRKSERKWQGRGMLELVEVSFIFRPTAAGATARQTTGQMGMLRSARSG